MRSAALARSTLAFLVHVAANRPVQCLYDGSDVPKRPSACVVYAVCGQDYLLLFLINKFSFVERNLWEHLQPLRMPNLLVAHFLCGHEFGLSGNSFLPCAGDNVCVCVVFQFCTRNLFTAECDFERSLLRICASYTERWTKELLLIWLRGSQQLWLRCWAQWIECGGALQSCHVW